MRNHSKSSRTPEAFASTRDACVPESRSSRKKVCRVNRPCLRFATAWQLPIPLRSKAKAGAEGIRTPDPHNAIVVLYQLSYDPVQAEILDGDDQIATQRVEVDSALLVDGVFL
jgi:hypothetical protein